MQAVVGDHPDSYDPQLGVFCPKTPMASDVGLEPLRGARDPARARKLLKQAGYAGEKAVLLVPSDYVTLKAVADAMAVRCRAAA